ncbi:MAG: hypothetical protein L3J35_12010 [Bacteroidales bacterium]|nr:hypothetical protein [Bacteroidales bacterium]
MGLQEDNYKLTEILNRLDILEQKVAVIEQQKDIKVSNEEKIKPDTQSLKYENKLTAQNNENKHLQLENKFGKYGLIWTGNIILFFGLIFMTQSIQESGHQIVAGVIGFLSVAAIFGLSVYIRKSLPYITLIFRITSVLLLYYFTLRLHFFLETPLISSKWVCIVLLLLLNGFHFFLSVKLKSKMFGVIALFLTITTAILSDSTHFMLSLITFISIVSIYFVFKNKWKALLSLSIILVYSSFLIWLSGNPVVGNEFKITEHHSYSIIYLFIIASAYTLITLLPKNKKISPDFILTCVILNGISFSLLIILYVLSFFPEDYIWIFFSVFIFCLGAAVTLKFKSEYKFAAPLYALYGFVMLSVTVYGYYQLPNSFFMLALESLLVVSMALWFRSKFIVIMNGILFIFLLITYLSLKDTVVSINFAFAIAAFVTARILNWKKDRLEIKTEFLRTTYLVAAFFMLLYALYEALPKEYITLSWTAAALLYYLISRVLNNVKYRWMAIFTFIITALYLLFFDLENISMALRIVAFMVLAIISITISIIYAQKSKKDITEKKE